MGSVMTRHLRRAGFRYRRRTKSLATLLLILRHFPSAVTLKRKSRPEGRCSSRLNNPRREPCHATHENESLPLLRRKCA